MSALSKAELKTGTIAIVSGSASQRFHSILAGTAASSQLAANAVAVFLPPIAVLAYVFAAWRLGSDMGWAAEFPVPNGLFSHWLVWVAVGVGIQMAGSLLNRQPRGDRPMPARSSETGR